MNLLAVLRGFTELPQLPVVLAQGAQPIEARIPQIPWAAISPELVLFGAGILALLLDTAGRNRLQASFSVAGVMLAGAGVAYFQLGDRPGSTVTVIAIVVAAAGLLQFALTALWGDRPRALGAMLAVAGFVGALGATIWQWATYAGQLVPVAGAAGGGAGDLALVGTQSLLGGSFAVDGVALFTRFTVCTAGIIAVPLGFSYLEERRLHRGEYYPLLLFAACGMTLLGAAADLLMVFVAVEALSLALYILAGFARRDLNSQESALKYFLLGAFSSALLLYGIALVYGATGTTNIARAGQVLQSVGTPTALALAAMALLIVGLGFKTALVPFHMWTPDVYQGAPTPVTGFMAAATKAAAFAAFLRIFVGALAGVQWWWTPALAVVAGLTMLVGAVLAVVQRDCKRILAYSAIAHAGYVAIGLVSIAPEGLGGGTGLGTGREATSAVLLYLFVYSVLSLGSFGVLALFERRSRKALTIDDLRGIGRRYPGPSILFALFLIALAGIPGTAGFTAKFGIVRAGIDAGQIALVVLLVVSSVIAAFFYLRIIAAMFVEAEPEEMASLPPLRTPTAATVGLALAAAAVVVLGLQPERMIELARQAATYAS